MWKEVERKEKPHSGWAIPMNMSNRERQIRKDRPDPKVLHKVQRREGGVEVEKKGLGKDVNHD